MVFFKRKLFWKIAALVAGFVAACTALIFLSYHVIIPRLQYNRAVQYLNEGKYEQAFAGFEFLGDYRDCREKASEVLFMLQENGLVDIHVGDTIRFGHYEQDDNASNGTEEIEWLVLAQEGDKVLLLSKYALDCQPYNEPFAGTTWESCTLRTWLNETFYETAFEPQHQALIQVWDVAADGNPEYVAPSGNDTQDRVFLLSIDEVIQYMPLESDRVCVATEYAKANDVYYTRPGGESWWWVRTPGMYDYYAAGVNPVGAVSTRGNNVNYSHGAVRPAIWIDFGK